MCTSWCGGSVGACQADQQSTLHPCCLVLKGGDPRSKSRLCVTCYLSPLGLSFLLCEMGAVRGC